jgi:DNA-binding NtrC family response regulator
MADRSAAPYALVVDDDDSILAHAVDILEEAGFRTLMALHAEEAINALEVHGDEVTLLFTDVEMPGAMSGFELAREVAARWPEIGVLVASGNCQPSDGDMPEGAIFVGKPFSAEVVRGRVHELLPDDKKPELLLRLMSSPDVRSR